MIGSYPHIYNIGHKAIKELLLDPVVVQEKVDGSQFSFGVIDGVLCFRSKGAEIYPETTDKLFINAIQAVRSAHLTKTLFSQIVYRGEVISRPKHSSLKYGRTPNGYIVLFDIMHGEEEYCKPEMVSEEAARLGLEAAPTLYKGMVTNLDQLTGLLDLESFLGGVKIEGVVIKNYARFTKNKKAMMGKIVSAAFKETHREEWKKENPTRGDMVERLVEGLRTDARWRKGVQHLRDEGRLVGTTQDIGPLIREVQEDVLEDEVDQIKEVLFQHFRQDITRGVVRGLAEWYKQRLEEVI